MNRKKIFLIGSILILSFLLVTQSVSTARAIDGFQITPLFPTSRIIMILDKGLETHVLSIDRYTEVTWINDSQSDVKIKFGKGTQCEEVSSEVFPGLGARLDPDKCFAISNSISPKGTLRFRFKEFGDYHYEVKYADTNRAEYGELKVF
jgi:hypothetical protein